MSEVSDLSEVLNDGVLSEPYTILRSTGTFQLGGWVTTEVSIPGYGTVSVASEQDLLMVPEGDRITGSMVFHSQQRIYETQLDSNPTYGQGGYGATKQWVSDKMFWNYQTYRVLKVGPYPNRNFWKAIAIREAGI